MILLITGAVVAIITLSVVAYVLYLKFQNVDSSLSYLYKDSVDAESKNKLAWQDLKRVDSELGSGIRNVGAEVTQINTVHDEDVNKLRTEYKTADDLILNRLDSSVATQQEINTSIDQTFNDFKIDTTNKFASVDSEFKNVDLKFKNVDSEFSTINTTLAENAQTFNTGQLNASVVNAYESDSMYSTSFASLSGWSSTGSMFADSVYSKNINSEGINVYTNIWDPNADKVYSVDNAGNVKTENIIAKKRVDAEYFGTPSIGMYSTGLSGADWNSYDGGFESTGGIGFRNSKSKDVSFVHDTNSGDTMIRGGLTASKDLNVNGNMSITGNVGFGGAPIPSYKLFVSGPSEFSGKIKVDSEGISIQNGPFCMGQTCIDENKLKAISTLA